MMLALLAEAETKHLVARMTTVDHVRWRMFIILSKAPSKLPWVFSPAIFLTAGRHTFLQT